MIFKNRIAIHTSISSMHVRALILAATLFVASGSFCYGTAILITDSTGFTTDVDLTPQVSPFTDANGNTATLSDSSGYPFALGVGASDTFTVTFAQPVMSAGFDLIEPDGVNLGAFQLSNGDSTGSSSCALAPPFQCFVGVTDNIPFTSFSILVSIPFERVLSVTEIVDFRYTPAASPEPGSWGLVAPFLIAGFAAWRLKKQAK